MVYKNNNELRLSQEDVAYTRGVEEFMQPVVESRDWWTNFETKYEDMHIVKFETVIYTDEQLARFEEIKNMDISEGILNDYVMDGTIGEGLEKFALNSLQDLVAGLIGGAI